MREHPFHWPPRDDLGFMQGVNMVEGGFMCAKYREDGLKLYTPGDTLWGFMEKLHDFHEGHWRLGLEAMGCVGMSRNVSRNHRLTGGEHKLNQS